MDLLALTNRPFNRRNRVYWQKLPPDVALYDTLSELQFWRFFGHRFRALISELELIFRESNIAQNRSQGTCLANMLSGLVFASKLDFDSLKASSTQIKGYF